LTRAHIKVKLRVYALEAHLPKIFGSSYSINMTIYYPPIEPSSAKSRYGKRRTYPLPLDIVYIKTYDYSNSIIMNGFITRITKRCLKL
jgi:hypothetical protein